MKTPNYGRGHLVFYQAMFDGPKELWAWIMDTLRLASVILESPASITLPLSSNQWTAEKKSGYPLTMYLPFTLATSIQVGKEKIRSMKINHASKAIAITNKTFVISLPVLLRLQFMLAIAICHEVVHAISFGKSPPRSGVYRLPLGN